MKSTLTKTEPSVENCYVREFEDAVVNLYLELSIDFKGRKILEKGRSFSFQSRKFAMIELYIKEIHNTVLILKNNTFLSRPGLKIGQDNAPLKKYLKVCNR